MIESKDFATMATIRKSSPNRARQASKGETEILYLLILKGLALWHRNCSPSNFIAKKSTRGTMPCVGTPATLDRPTASTWFMNRIFSFVT
jgi:hypothetical protein